MVIRTFCKTINLGLRYLSRVGLNQHFCHFDQREKSSKAPRISAPEKIPRFAQNDIHGLFATASYKKKFF
jgi:hypothetical protein